MTREDEIVSWLRLANSDGLGAIGFEKLMQKCGWNVEAATSLWKKPLAAEDWARKELETAYQNNIHIVLKKDNIYPNSLLKLRDAPPILYVMGRIDLLVQENALAIVGSRNASLSACGVTEKIAFDLTEKGILIVSGMARGIDSAAHKGALRACEGKGATIAVLGTGIDVVYPPENKNLYHQIAKQGLIVSEMPLGSNALGGSFPRRNRIISGLSKGVLVTEASEKSGSLITARFGIEQQKKIFAIPGNPADPRAAGPNKLLKAGAYWTENADDILKVINISDSQEKVLNIGDFCGDLFAKPLDNVQKTDDIPLCQTEQIESFLSSVPVGIDEIIRTSGFDAATVSMQLLDLELSGKIVRLPGNKVALKTK